MNLSYLSKLLSDRKVLFIYLFIIVFVVVVVVQDELTAELEELEQEVLDSQLLGADAPPVTVPNVPTTEPGMKFVFVLTNILFYNIFWFVWGQESFISICSGRSFSYYLQ